MAAVAPQLEPVNMRMGDVLRESGGTFSHVYFPTTSIVSLLHVLESGESAEVAVVGNEGIVSTLSQVVVQSAGSGFRLPKAAIVQAFAQDGEVTKLLLRYTQALMTQIAQTDACHRHHSLNQRLCRLLLFNMDRAAYPRAFDDPRAHFQWVNFRSASTHLAA